MSEISELMASNDPMATSVMSIGPAPPVNTTPSMSEATAQIHEKQVEAFTTNNPLSSGNVSRETTKRKMHKLNVEQREALIVACCAFIVLLPNIQQMILQQLPVLGTNSTLYTLVNSVLIGLIYFGLKEHILDVL